MNKPTLERIVELRAKVNGVVNLKPGFGLSTGDLTDLLAILDQAEALPQLIWVLRNLENDDGSIPSTIWNVRNAALAKLEGKL